MWDDLILAALGSVAFAEFLRNVLTSSTSASMLA